MKSQENGNGKDHPIEIFNKFKTVFKIERNGRIIWFVNGEERVCNDSKELAIAFMNCIIELSPNIENPRQLSEEAYDSLMEIKNKK